MSEFTVGTLFLKGETEQVEAKLQAVEMDYKLQELNETWSAFFVEDEFLMDTETVGKLAEVSKAAPLLYLVSAEDHGWEYRLFHQGKRIASVDVSYDRDFYMTQRLAEQRYPDADVIDEFMASQDPEKQAVWQALQQEVLDSEAYRQAQVNQYTNANVEAFQHFGLSSEEIAALRELLTLAFFQSHSTWDQIAQFKELLGIEEMAWLSYRFVGE